ncbi:AraC family ligand binding domain-containing protein [Hoeflea alexandrii]|uniref:AraC family ligand binding domain-containing protein n=1 Tax=Hoeflea alexandrii TaxID=288436 RepID=UPI003CCD26EC
MLTYVPAGAEVEGWSELTQRQNSYSAIYFNPGELHEELDQRFPDDWDVRLYFRDPELSACLHRFTRLLEQGDGADDLYAETLGLMTVLTLHKNQIDQPSSKARFAAPRPGKGCRVCRSESGQSDQPGRSCGTGWIEPVSLQQGFQGRNW